jgi:hypothetical protein
VLHRSVLIAREFIRFDPRAPREDSPALHWRIRIGALRHRGAEPIRAVPRGARAHQSNPMNRIGK